MKNWIYLFVLALAACNPGGVKELPDEHAKVFIGEGYYKQAVSLLSAPPAEISLAHYNQAVGLYQKSLTYYPFHAGIEEEAYLTMIRRDIFYYGFASSDTIDMFKQLDKQTKKNVVPPSFVEFAVLNYDNYAYLSKLLNAIKDQPYSAALWSYLSDYYEHKKNYWLAVSASKRAAELQPSDASYLFQYGFNINSIIEQQVCWFDEKSFAKKAVTQMVKASVLEKNYVYIDNAGLQYLRLGVFPLAYQNAKKAYEKEQNQWTVNHLVYSAILTGRYAEAEEVYRAYIQKEWRLEAEIIALAMIENGNDTEAFDILKRSRESNPGALKQIFHHWIYTLEGKAFDNVSFYEFESGHDWYDRIVMVAEEPESFPDKYLIEFAQNSCTSTQAYFYSAYALWKSGQVEKSKEYLKKVREQGATQFFEYVWVDRILEKL